MTSAQYQGEFDNACYQGYRLAWVSGYGIAAGARYAAIWKAEGIAGSDLASIDAKVKAYMTKHAIPGLSMAITKDERLVFAKGYGDADPSTGEKVNPKHRFRVASVSKPITAVDVMDLVEAGKLSSTTRCSAPAPSSAPPTAPRPTRPTSRRSPSATCSSTPAGSPTTAATRCSPATPATRR